MSRILAIDHVAITVADLAGSCAFYDDLFGTEVVAEHVIGGRVLVRQLAIGGAVLSIHQKGNGVDLVAERPTVGAADICLRWNGSVSEMLDLLEGKNVNILEGPVARMTADRQLGKVCKSPGVEVWLSYPRKTRTKGVPR